jgi:beta-ureidopropionase / N-carbamoyl-L-amino-acid hydrolase
MRNHPSLPIDADRLWRSHEEMGQLGATPKGGVNRQALTAQDQQARALFTQWAQAAGCIVETDCVGNLFARRLGRDPKLPAVCTGSHLDTQPTGGKYDGAYGVLAGLEILRALNDAGIETERSIEVVAWTNEEGTRFAHSGSALFAGKADLEQAYNATDPTGIRFEDALTAIEAKGPLPLGNRPYDSLFEAHIEQGPILEREGYSVGIVTGARSQVRYDVTVSGAEGHAGTMPMTMRQDALTAAARLVVALEKIGQDHPPQGVCTVGALSVYPNSRNTIPGTVTFSIDLRHPTQDGITAMRAAIDDAMQTEQAKGKVTVCWTILDQEPPLTFDQDLVALLKAGAASLDIQVMDIFSMAGHDACYLSQDQPTAMVFVPCKDGISHNELESATAEDLAAGVEVLASAILARAMQR